MSVANPKLFEEIPSDIRPDLLPWNRTLRMANGDKSLPRGKVKLKLDIDESQVKTRHRGN